MARAAMDGDDVGARAKKDETLRNRGGRHRHVVELVVPESLGLGIARTPAVEASLPAMVDTVMSLVGDSGGERHAYVGMDVAVALGV